MATTQFGPIWKQKLRTWHARLDLNGDGQVTKEDFLILALRCVTVAHATTKAAQEIEAGLDKFWSNFLAGTAASGIPLSADAYLVALEAQGKKLISKTVDEVYSLVFDVLDVNNDGHISLEEYTNYYKILNLSPSYAAESFNVVDSDHDGCISRAEFMFAVDDFFTSENWSNFFGPAVEEKPIECLTAKSQEPPQRK